MSNNIQLNHEQENALDKMLSGHNVFISGKAGSGKTTIINEFKCRCTRDLVCLAPTGIAAQAIDGTTVHSFFNLSAGVAAPDQSSIDPLLCSLLQAVEVILIDEVSMCRSDVFQAIDSLLRQAAVPGCQHLPFGGTQIIVIGDLFQLPPVVDNITIQQYLESVFNGVYAFNTEAWRNAGFESIILDHVHRQDDPFFLDLLDAVRHNTPELSRYLQTVNDNLVGEPGDDCLCICCKRISADVINNAALARLPDTGFYSMGSVTGDFPDDALPTAFNLEIKRGARVMLLANKLNQVTYEFDFVNGTVGTVVDYDPVRINVTVQLDNGRTVTVGKYCWSNYEYNVITDDYGNQHIEQQETGKFRQLPLAPAYAITIHKAQGKTLDRTHLVLGNGCFAEGQLYTALSRVRSLENLTIDRPIRDLEGLTDPQVAYFYQCIERGSLYKYYAVPAC